MQGLGFKLHGFRVKGLGLKVLDLGSGSLCFRHFPGWPGWDPTASKPHAKKVLGRKP